MIYSAFNDEKQQEFINFVLDKYVQDDVDELAKEKMRSMVELKYNTISDAAAVLGSHAAIGQTFRGFQKYLYQTDELSTGMVVSSVPQVIICHGALLIFAMGLTMFD